MVITIDVQKKSVNKIQDQLWNITLTLIVTDSVTPLVPIINKDFSEKYRTGMTISQLTSRFLTVMQSEINVYKSDQVIYNHTQLTTSVNYLKVNLAY